jgi:hypothetical protein
VRTSCWSNAAAAIPDDHAAEALAVKVVSEDQEFPVEEVNAETLKKAVRLVGDNGLQPGIGGPSQNL